MRTASKQASKQTSKRASEASGHRARRTQACAGREKVKLGAATPSLAGMQLEGWGGRAGSARLPITGGGGGGGGGLLEEVRREVVELRLPAAGDPEPRSAPSQAAPSGAAPVPALAAPRARSLVQPEPWGRSLSDRHGAGGLVPLGVPPRPPAPRSRGYPRWVLAWGGLGRLRLRPRAAGAAGSRELYGRAVGDDGAIPAAGAAARRGSERLGMGQSLGEPHWRSGTAPSGHTGASRAPGDSGNSSGKFSETGRKVFLRRVCEALCVRAPASPLPSPLTLTQSSSSWQPPPPDRTGQDAFGVPSAPPLPLPTPSGPLGLVSYSSLQRGRHGGGGGESNPSCRAGRTEWRVRS